MKITFILPAIGKKQGERYIKTWKMEPLTIAVLKALTPPDIETEFFDDRIELIDFETKTDLVAITAETYTALRAYNIAEKFRKRNIPIVIGGYHATLMPEEVMQYANSVVVGNADGIWHKVIEDFKCGNLKQIYHGQVGYREVQPDKSIYKDKKYLPITLIETGRGCSFSCEFCAISSYYKSEYCPRPIENIVEDIKRSKGKYFFFVDDNIVANPKWAIELFKAIAPLKIRWSGQGSLTIAKNPELLYWMKKSGCDVLLIGFESLDEENLNQMNKGWNYKLGEREELIKKIHDAGISIYATFVFGFDFDTIESFERTVEFSKKHGFFFAAFNHLLPFPGTPLYERLKKENRLINEKWWLDSSYEYGDIAFKPKKLTPKELSDYCVEARKEFFRLSSVFSRGLKLLKREKNPFLSLIFWTQNIKLGEEVSGKLALPLGSGLDELPK